MDEYDNEDGVFMVESVDCALNKTELKVVLDVHDHLVEFKIDTGAKCNVISKWTYQRIRSDELLDTTKTVRLVAFGGSTINTLGAVTFPYKGPEAQAL